MKNPKCRLQALLAVLSLLIVGLPVAFAQQQGGHSVTGSAVGIEDGIPFRQTIVVHQNPSGQVWGDIVVNFDLSAIGMGTMLVRMSPTCMTVQRPFAWIGSVIVESSNEEFIPIGTSVITLVGDLGTEGTDTLHTERSASTATCIGMPDLLKTAVESGNYDVH